MATRKVMVIPPTINPLTRISNTMVRKDEQPVTLVFQLTRTSRLLHMRHRLTITQALLKTTAIGSS